MGSSVVHEDPSFSFFEISTYTHRSARNKHTRAKSKKMSFLFGDVAAWMMVAATRTRMQLAGIQSCRDINTS